jgi:hypothetical protein
MSQEPTAGASRLDAHLAQLPREIVPERDLWPHIERALEVLPVALPTRRWHVPLALAAGLAVAVTVGMIGWQVARWGGAGATADSSAAERALSANPGYVRTRATLEQTYRERLELLAPDTRHRVERDLALIRAANADIRRALASDPDSAVLSRLLESTLQQEFDLYATVVRTTEPVNQRNPT